MSNILIPDLHDTKELDAGSIAKVCGGIWKKNGVIPGYVAPTVYYDDVINVSTRDPSTGNVGYDSPFTPIH
jgi:hypothetical protein